MDAKPPDDLDALRSALARCPFVELAYNPKRSDHPYRATLPLSPQGPWSEADGASLRAAVAEARNLLPAWEPADDATVPVDPDPEATTAELYRALRSCAYLETSFLGGAGGLHPFRVRLVHEDQRSGLGTGPTLRAALTEALAEYRLLDGDEG